MKDIRLFVTDLDGTLLLDDHMTVSERNREALLAMKARGIRLCACTGRVLGMLPPAVTEIGFDYAITSNGASCIDLRTGEHLFTAYMSAARARFAWSLLRDTGCMTEWFVRDELLMDRHTFDQWETRLTPIWHRSYLGAGRGTVVEDIESFFAEGAPGLEKISVFDCPKDKTETVVSRMRATGGYEIASSLGTNCEISDISADKGQALLTLCRSAGILPARTIAFGDGTNDIKLMEAAGTAVVMANAMEGLKKVGRTFTDSNEEDGVAKYLERYIL